jgi:hypothetical protein
MYAILLNEQQELDLETTATILAKAQDLVYADATRAVRSCTGILAKNLPAQEAEAIASELNNNGVGCFTMAMADFYNPPEARVLPRIELGPERFGPMDLYGRVTPVPWESIVLLSVGHIPEQEREHYTLGEGSGDGAFTIRVARAFVAPSVMGTPAVARSEQTPPPSQVKTKAMCVLDVFARAPNEGHWRIEHNGFSYDCLGPNLAPRSDENFRTLVGEMVRYATACFANVGLNLFLDGAPEQRYTYGDIHQFDDENLWLLQKVYLNLRAQ